jgi:hypothetical protein
MWTPLRIVIVALACLTPASWAQAQSVDASGHWQGAVSSPQGELRFELDLENDPSGGLGGTLDIPGEKIAGLPLREVLVRGASIEFRARTDQGFRGDIAADGQTMSGTFAIEGNALPFFLTRTGTARVRPAVVGGPIDKAFEGRWSGRLPANGMRLVLELSGANGDTSTAVLINLDEGGLLVPAAASVRNSELTLAFPAIGGAYVATLTADGRELTGTYTQGARSAALTFQRAEKE